MDSARDPADSHRAYRLAQKFHDKSYRDSYVGSYTRRFLAHQMREFRGEQPQTEFADTLGTSQTIVSRLENPNYSGWSLRTMLDTARKLDVAVLARFVDFPTFIKYTDETPDIALHPAPYDPTTVDSAFEPAAQPIDMGYSDFGTVLLGFGNVGASGISGSENPFFGNGGPLVPLNSIQSVDLGYANWFSKTTNAWPALEPVGEVAKLKRQLAIEKEKNVRLQFLLLAQTLTGQERSTPKDQGVPWSMAFFGAQPTQGRAI